MSLQTINLREAIKLNEKLNIFAEYLNILEDVTNICSVDCSNRSDDQINDIINSQKEIKNICEKIYQKIEIDEYQGLEDIISSLEKEIEEFEKFKL